MTDLVKSVKGVLLVSTLDMWEPLKVHHKAIMDLVTKYETEFQSIRPFDFLKAKSTGGRPTTYCMLDEEQATFLITLMRNSEAVVPFKLKLTREFYRMKQRLIQLASQNQNAEWLEQRKAGKETRVLTTDTIKAFTEYATAQGSQNAGKYYASISTMENKALFLLEQQYKNLRDMLNIHQLSTVKSADMIVMKALVDGMAQKLHYKEIYKLAKTRVEGFAEMIGKTLIPAAQLQIGGK
jgi:phage regulator Rha-like protein